MITVYKIDPGSTAHYNPRMLFQKWQRDTLTRSTIINCWGTKAQCGAPSWAADPVVPESSVHHHQSGMVPFQFKAKIIITIGVAVTCQMSTGKMTPPPPKQNNKTITDLKHCDKSWKHYYTIVLLSPTLSTTWKTEKKNKIIGINLIKLSETT